MADPYSNSPSKYHLLFGRKPSNSVNIEVLTSIKPICEDGHIEKLEDNQWKCLWCDVTFQGINAKKALAHVIGTISMHIKRCTASIDQAHLSRYKELQQIKASKKGLLKYYSQKMISSISRLQDKSSEVVESNIQRNSRGLYLSNTTAIYDSSYIRKSFSQYPESNQTTPQRGSMVFTEDNNTHKMMTSNETRLTVAIADLIISEGLSFNIFQKPSFKVLGLARTVSKCYQCPNRNLLFKALLDVIHDQNMERNLILIEKESDIFGLLFLGDGATISRVPLLNILVSWKKLSVAVL